MGGPPIETAVLEALAADSPLHVLDLADRLSADPVAVDLACARLADRNEVRPTSDGTYAVTEAGRRRVSDGDANRPTVT